MKVFGILGSRAEDYATVTRIGSVYLGGQSIPLGIIESPQPPFDPDRPENHHMVLVRVNAMSCNFRDRGIALLYAEQVINNPRVPFAFVGSEFAGVVADVGKGVRSVKTGEAVMPDASYPWPPAEGVSPGIVSNHAGAGWLRVHESKLSSVPVSMTAVQAAAFSLGAQTSVSMVRRARVRPGDRVLVLSARSNTSRFLIDAARSCGAEIWAGTSAPERFEAPSGVHVVRSSPMPGVLFDADVSETIGFPMEGFNVVLDPFFDLHLPRIAPHISVEGRYVTCGVQAQHPTLASGSSERSADGAYESLITVAIMKNLELIGNCIGTKQDLQQGIRLFDAGKMSPKIDSIFDPAQAVEFFQKSFNGGAREGKVIMTYSDADI